MCFFSLCFSSLKMAEKLLQEDLGDLLNLEKYLIQSSNGKLHLTTVQPDAGDPYLVAWMRQTEFMPTLYLIGTVAQSSGKFQLRLRSYQGQTLADQVLGTGIKDQCLIEPISSFCSGNSPFLI